MIKKMYILGIIAIFFTLAPSVDALTVQTPLYSINNQIVNMVSEHNVSFETSTPITTGETITLILPSEFSIPSVPSSSDIEVYVDGGLLGMGDWALTYTPNTFLIEFQNGYPAGSDVEIILQQVVGITNPLASGWYAIDSMVNGVFDTSFNVYLFPSEVINVQASVLGDPVDIGGSNSSSGGSVCFNCFFNETEPYLDENGIIVTFKGYGPPNGSVGLFIDGQFISTTEIDERGIFNFSIDNVSSGLHNFTFRGFDMNRISLSPYTLTLYVGQKGFIYANNVFLPPSIYIEPHKDDSLVFFGYSLPFGEVCIIIDDEIIAIVKADEDGFYSYISKAEVFTSGDHTIVSVLKGVVGELNSEKKTFSLNENNGELYLDFIGNLFFEYIVEAREEKETTIPFTSLLLASIPGGVILFLLFLFLLLCIKKLKNR